MQVQEKNTKKTRKPTKSQIKSLTIFVCKNNKLPLGALLIVISIFSKIPFYISTKSQAILTMQVKLQHESH